MTLPLWIHSILSVSSRGFKGGIVDSLTFFAVFFDDSFNFGVK